MNDMSLREDLVAKQIECMKAKDKETLAVIRNVMAAVKKFEIDEGKDVVDADVLQLIKMQVKQLNDAKKDFAAGGRDELVAQAENEISILKAYLPEEISDEEIMKLVEEAKAATGAEAKSDMGKLMGAAMKLVDGRADGNRVRSAVQSLLS